MWSSLIHAENWLGQRENVDLPRQVLSRLIDDCRQGVPLIHGLLDLFSVQFVEQFNVIFDEINVKISEQFFVALEKLNLSSEIDQLRSLLALFQLDDIHDQLVLIQNHFQQIDRIFEGIDRSRPLLSSHRRLEIFNEVSASFVRSSVALTRPIPLPCSSDSS